MPGAGDGLNLANLSDAVIDRLLEIAGPQATRCPFLAVDVRQLGGAAGRPVPGGGVVDHFSGEYPLFAVGMAPTPEIAALVDGAAAGMVQSLQPYAAAKDYLNFRERAVDPASIWGSDLAKLRAIRAAVDPVGILRANHGI